MTVNHRFGRVLVLCAVMVTLFLPGCSAPIPREDVPTGWALDVHQPGAWWTQPLIPRSVIIQRCPPPRGWASDPDLTRVTGLPPGSDIEYSFLTDDYHCLIGWSEPVSTMEPDIDDLDSEVQLRRICSSTGLPMDASWRFLGHKATERVGDLPSGQEDGWTGPEGSTAGFIDEYGTVVACLVENWDESGDTAFVELSVGTDVARTDAAPVCPVSARNLAAAEDGSLSEYQLRGAGAVRDDEGQVLAAARTLRIGLVADTETSSHPVVDGIAIVDAWVTPEAAIRVDWDDPPPVEGQVLGEDGSVLATCRS
jgi:hypothetical protein